MSKPLLIVSQKTEMTMIIMKMELLLIANGMTGDTENAPKRVVGELKSI